MSGFDKARKKIAKLRKAQGKVIGRAILKNKAEILDLITEEQLFKLGVNSDGIELSSFQPYTPRTKQIKGVKGQPVNRVTLRDEGDFHESFNLKIVNNKLLIFATDPKTEKLTIKYGEEIFGLTDDSLREVRRIIKSDIVKGFRNEL